MFRGLSPRRPGIPDLDVVEPAVLAGVGDAGGLEAGGGFAEGHDDFHLP